MGFRTDDDVVDWVICRDLGDSTEVFDVEHHPQWLRARMASGVWATPGRIQKHIDIWAAIPFWALALLTGWYPVFSTCRWVVRFGRRRFKSANMCHKCEYDLTGNVSGVCPECGVPSIQLLELADPSDHRLHPVRVDDKGKPRQE
ncbi:MAG: hypothetical protein AABZ47_08310 [Planctomycetota bacterium]